jgi:hypothetical protein
MSSMSNRKNQLNATPIFFKEKWGGTLLAPFLPLEWFLMVAIYG